jgi:hypothetical protein
MVGTVAPSFDYDAFISYRRGDGMWHARTLRQRLQDIRVPTGVATARSDGKLRIYLDQIYERATDDFFENTIKPALAASRHLVVVKTPSAMTALPDGSPNWLVREIDYFCSLPTAGRSISVAITSGDLSSALPGRLGETHPNIERLDLRRWRRYRTFGIDDQLLSLAATLHEIRPSDMPALRQEDARRIASQKRRRRLAIGLAAVLILATTAVAIFQYVRVREESHRRDIATAAALWNRLNFSDDKRMAADDLNALWEVRLANDDLRNAFVTELVASPDRGNRVSRRPGPVMRAIYTQWPEEQAARVFDAVVRQTATREPFMRWELWRTSEAVARVLPPGRVGAAVTSMLVATKGRTEPQALPTLRVLAATLTPVDGQAILTPIVNQITAASSPGATRECWAAIAAFGGAASPEQATALGAAAVRSFETTTEPDDLEMVSRAVGALPGPLTTADARRMMAALAKQIVEQPRRAQALGTAVGSLASKLPADEAARAFDLVTSQFDRTEVFVIAEYVSAATALAIRLPAVQPAAFVDRVVRGTMRTGFLLHEDALAGAVSGIAERLSGAQAVALLPSVVQALDQLPIEAAPASINRAVTAVVAKLEPLQVEMQFDIRLGLPLHIGVLPSPRLWTPTMLALAARFSPDRRASHAAQLAADCGRLPPTTDTSVVLPLKQLASALGTTCAVGAAPLPVLEQLLASQLTTTEPLKFFMDAQRFQVMAEMVTADQARALLTPVLAILNQRDEALSPPVVLTLLRWFERGLLTSADATTIRAVAVGRMAPVKSLNGLQSLATLAIRVPGQLSSSDGQMVLTALLKPNDAQTADLADVFDVRRRIAESMRELAPHLASAQRQAAANAMRSELAWADTDALALAAANAAIALLPEEREARSAALVEMLKYPAAATGPAAEALMTALRDTAKMPGTAVHGDSTFGWVRTAFPRANLDALPTCPPPKHAGLACPATGARRDTRE